MKEQLLRKIVSKEMKDILEENAKEDAERAKYQSYQDMYLTPSSSWRVKRNTDLVEDNGRMCTAKVGDVHTIQEVKYDFYPCGEVITKHNNKIYSIHADDFRESFKMINRTPITEALNGKKYKNMKLQNNIKDSSIKEEIKKLSKVKNYFGKNIRESIEKLESAFLIENKMDITDSSEDFHKKTVTIIYDGTYDEREIRRFMELNYDAEKIKILNRNKPGIVVVKILSKYEREPEDAHLDKDFENRISGYEDYGDFNF